MTDRAPFDIGLSEGPDFAEAFWVEAADGVRLRTVTWVPEKAHSTIVIFTGRTEYVEKYGRVARAFADAGHAVATIDWRGQGRSDRLINDDRLGHVLHFHDYQHDVLAFLSALEGMGLPKPFHLIAHSMGGAIGMRALLNGAPISRAVFSAPMWGIFVSPLAQPFAATLPWLARRVRQHERVTPGTTPGNYISQTPFEDNLLTNDRDHYEKMQRQIAADPSFALGGPTLNWLYEARAEIRALHASARPTIPCLTFVGTEEKIVDAYSIEEFHRGWSSGKLTIVEGARHELMMEAPHMRDRFLSETLAFFAAG